MLTAFTMARRWGSSHGDEVLVGRVFPLHVLDGYTDSFCNEGMGYRVRAPGAAHFANARDQGRCSSCVAFREDVVDRPAGFSWRLVAPMCHVFTFVIPTVGAKLAGPISGPNEGHDVPQWWFRGLRYEANLRPCTVLPCLIARTVP